jgi:DNA-binding transcriptional ArsR family regulator
LGVGGSYNSRTTPNVRPTASTLQDFFQEIISEINKNTGKEVIIHYNNLELLPEKNIRKIFDNLRDFFQTERVNFVFVGNLMFYSTVQSIPRFSSILSDTPIQIKNLSLAEVEEIVQIRFSKLKIKTVVANTFIPYTNDALKSLYDLFQGNIRNILNSLSAAILEVTKERPVILDSYDLAVTLKKILEHRYLSELPPKAKEILLEAVKSEEITNRNLSQKTGVARSNVSTYLKQLQGAGCIYPRRKDGKDKYWSAEPKIKWYLLKVDAKAKSQKRVTDY